MRGRGGVRAWARAVRGPLCVFAVLRRGAGPGCLVGRAAASPPCARRNPCECVTCCCRRTGPHNWDPTPTSTPHSLTRPHQPARGGVHHRLDPAAAQSHAPAPHARPLPHLGLRGLPSRGPGPRQPLGPPGGAAAAGAGAARGPHAAAAAVRNTEQVPACVRAAG